MDIDQVQRKYNEAMIAAGVPEHELTKPVTGREMCELIAEMYSTQTGNEVDPEEIWNYSPTGELSFVFLAYQLALIWKHSQASPSDNGA